MTPENMFKLISVLAGISWLLIIVISRFWKFADQITAGIVVVIIALMYGWLNFSYIGESGGAKGFLSFEGVTRIFSNPYLINAGWAHIIAIDILVGLWIKNDARRNSIPYVIMIPLLLGTIMFAPLGYVAYLLVRWLKTGRYFQNN